MYNGTDCIEWQKSKDRYGYGQQKFQGKVHFAHRVAFYKTYGWWPTPQCNHYCGNPGCINARHLYESTHADNMRDMFERGRTNRGTDIAAYKREKRRRIKAGTWVHR